MTERSEGTLPPWELVSSERGEDYEMFRVRRDRARSPRTGTVQEFNIAESPDGVTVLALTPAGELVLVEQYRHPLREVSLETPSGVVDEGEPPLRAAARELKEETGYAGEDAEHVGTLVLNPSWQTTRVHVVVVRGARREGEKEQDAGEDVRVRLLPLEEVYRGVRRGEIASAVVVSALMLLRLHEDGSGG